MKKYRYIGSDEHSKQRVNVVIEAETLNEAFDKGLKLYGARTKGESPAEAEIEKLTKER